MSVLQAFILAFMLLLPYVSAVNASCFAALIADCIDRYRLSQEDACRSRGDRPMRPLLLSSLTSPQRLALSAVLLAPYTGFVATFGVVALAALFDWVA